MNPASTTPASKDEHDYRPINDPDAQLRIAQALEYIASRLGRLTELMEKEELRRQERARRIAGDVL